MHASEKRGWWSRSYFGRHWRGELSLPVSYFVNGLLGTVAATVIVFAISATVAEGYAPWPGFLAIVGIWSVALLVSLWQIVGIWRSANNHPKRGGRVFWAGVAKLMMILAMLQTASAFAQNGWPQIKESFLIIAGDPSIGTFALRLMNGGTEIEFAGGIPFGAAEEVAKLLNAAPQVDTVHLSSQGGRIAAAEKLRDLIRERGLSTYVSGECLSACTVAYLGGRERYLHRNGRLGFHAGSFPGLSESDLWSENRRIANEAVSLGVESRFAERAYLSPADSMWFPTRQELIDAHFVTRIATGQFALSSLGPQPSRDAIASSLKDIPLYATLSNVEPQVFGQIIDIFYDGVVKGEPEFEVLALMRSAVSSLMEKYAPVASDEALLALGAVLVDELEAIGATDKLACYAFLFPQQSQVIDIGNYLSPELQTRDLSATELIVITGATGRTYERSQSRLDELYGKVFTFIENNYNSTIVDNLSLMAVDISALPKQEICGITYVFYKAILSLPADEASDLLRDMFSQ